MPPTIDYHRDLKITNLEQLAKGTGCRFLLVIESPYPMQYAAVRWLRKMPQTVPRCYHVIRLP